MNPASKTTSRTAFASAVVLWALTAGVATGRTPESSGFVHSVDYREAPAAGELAARARTFCNEMYPRIVELLEQDASKSPRQFDIVFKERLKRDGPGHTKGTTIFLPASQLMTNAGNLAWFSKYATNLSWYANGATNISNVLRYYLEMDLVHEMAHVVQQYRGIAPFYLSSAPSYWEEGIADYVRFKLGYTNAVNGACCGTEYPHYTSGYFCAGAFLLHLDATYGTKVIRQLNLVLRRGDYSDSFFVKATGRSLTELWEEFQKTSFFTPMAAEIVFYSEPLGYSPGKPPKDYEHRIQEYLKQKPDGRITLEARDFLADLANQGTLPGWPGEAMGRMSFGIRASSLPEGYPYSRTFNGQKAGDPSILYYVVGKPSPNGAWFLKRAWRTCLDGRVIEEYPSP